MMMLPAPIRLITQRLVAKLRHGFFFRTNGHKLESRRRMRKLWVKAWITLDGVFDADTMDHWWQNTNSPERMQYIKDEYEKGDAYLMGRVTYEMLYPGWSTQTTGDG